MSYRQRRPVPALSPDKRIVPRRTGAARSMAPARDPRRARRSAWISWTGMPNTLLICTSVKAASSRSTSLASMWRLTVMPGLRTLVVRVDSRRPGGWRRCTLVLHVSGDMISIKCDRQSNQGTRQAAPRAHPARAPSRVRPHLSNADRMLCRSRQRRAASASRKFESGTDAMYLRRLTDQWSQQL